MMLICESILHYNKRKKKIDIHGLIKDIIKNRPRKAKFGDISYNVLNKGTSFNAEATKNKFYCK